MLPEICQFPSLHFYDSKLMNREKMSNKSASFHEIGVLDLYLFYDIMDGQELCGKKKINSGASSLIMNVRLKLQLSCYDFSKGGTHPSLLVVELAS